MNVYKLLKVIFIITIFLVGNNRCIKDVEHRNPLDPESNEYNRYSQIKGQISSLYRPFKLLPNAEIRVIPINYITYSDINGEFLIDNLEHGDYTIFVSAPGYAPDSAYIHLEKKSKKDIGFNLNGLPELTNFKIIIGIIQSWLHEDMYVIEVESQGHDLDGSGDISHVDISIPEIDFRDTLIRISNLTSDPALFYKLFELVDLEIESLHQLVGQQIYLEIFDLPGSKYKTAPVYISRIIESQHNQNSIISPKGFQKVSSKPDLFWNKTNIMFEYTQKIEVTLYNDELHIKDLVWSKENLHSDSTHIQVDQHLISGSYYWTISIVDEFGNWNKSKEGSFEVE